MYKKRVWLDFNVALKQPIPFAIKITGINMIWNGNTNAVTTYYYFVLFSTKTGFFIVLVSS